MAISVVQQWVALAAGTTAIDATGADCLSVVNIGVDNGFATGKAIPTALSFAGIDMLAADGGTPGNGYAYRYLNVAGSGTVANGYGLWVMTAPTSGTNDLVLTNQGGTYGAGPVAVYALFSGVQQTTPIRTGSVVADNSLGTTASFSPTGLTAGDLLNAICGDFGDVTHTATGSGSIVLEGAAVNSESIVINQFTATGSTATVGVGNGANLFGALFAYISAPPAAAAGAALARRRSSLICR